MKQNMSELLNTLLNSYDISFEFAPCDQTYQAGDVRFHRPSLSGDLRSACETFLSDVPQVEFRMKTRTSVLLAAKFEQVILKRSFPHL